MLRFLRNHLHGTTEFRVEDINDFFNYQPTLRHGFPQNISAIAHDYVLGLMAVAIRDGHVRIFGSQNVEWYCVVPGNLPIAHMHFACGTGALIVVASDQSFHKLQLKSDKVELSSINPQQRLKRIKCCEMRNERVKQESNLLIGTIIGNVFALCSTTLELSELILYDEDILKNIPCISDENRSVDQIAVNPVDSMKILIIFGCHLVVLFNIESKSIIRFWNIQQALTYVTWHYDGKKFLISHKDGSLDTWSIQEAEPIEASCVPFGPFPCTSIGKVLWVNAINEQSAIKLYSGGMPRASYGDRYTLSAVQMEKIVVFDFGSAIVDFFVIPSLQNDTADWSNALGLMVFCEQELVCIDLSEKSWPVLDLPYLHCMHSSQITCNIHVSSVEEHVWKDLLRASEAAKKNWRQGKWPIFAGRNLQAPTLCAATNIEKRQLLITGHENGTVKLWSTGSASLQFLLTINTAAEFQGGSNDAESPQDNESYEMADWPPFRKVGIYDGFCDDPRLAIQKICFDPKSGQLAIGGHAGHVIVYDIDGELLTNLSTSDLFFDIVDNSTINSRFVHQKPLPSRKTSRTYPMGFHPYKTNSNISLILRIRPALPIIAIATLHARNLVAFGCEYGFVLCDMKNAVTLIKNCLMSVEEIIETSTFSGTLSRFKSMKKSIRQSFRRKKKIQSENTGNEAGCSRDDIEDVKPVERQVVSRSEVPLNVCDSLPSAVRILKFFNAILSTSTPSDSLWVGSNGGLILVYTVVDDASKPEDACVLVKEVHLHHRAPVIDIVCLTFDDSPIGKGVQKVMICTEEQIKFFLLPSLKPIRPKYKLTSVEGSRLRKAQLLTLRNANNRKLFERFLIVLTNQGEIIIFSANNLKRCAKVQFTKAIDVIAIGSALLSPHGEIFFLRPGSSEFQRSNLTPVQHNNLISPIRNHCFP